MGAHIVAVHRSGTYTFTKPTVGHIRLVAGIGVDGDVHAGTTVKHRSRVARDPTRPNLRQVHLLHAELHEELAARGFDIAPGAMGENVTTRGISLLELPAGARLKLGASAIVEITGLRNPCAQLDKLGKGLMQALLAHAPDGSLIRKAGVMSIVIAGGDVYPGDRIAIELPPSPYRALGPV